MSLTIKTVEYGVEVTLDGQKIQELRSVKVECPLDDVVTVDMQVLATREIDITLEDPLVNIHFILIPGYKLELEEKDGRRRYFAVEDQ